MSVYFYALIDSKNGSQYAVFKNVGSAVLRLEALFDQDPEFAKTLDLVRYVSILPGRFYKGVVL